MSQSSPDEPTANEYLLRELIRLLSETSQARQTPLAQATDEVDVASPLALVNYPFDVRADVLDLKSSKPVSKRRLRREVQLLNRNSASLAGHAANELYLVLASVIRDPQSEDEQRLADLLDQLKGPRQSAQQDVVRVPGLYLQLELRFREGSLIIAGALTILVVKSLLSSLGLGAVSGVGSFAMQRVLTRVLGPQLERNGMQITINGPVALISGNVATGNIVRGPLTQSSAGSGIEDALGAGEPVRARSRAALGVAFLGVLGLLVSVGTLIFVVLIASHLGVIP